MESLSIILSLLSVLIQGGNLIHKWYYPHSSGITMMSNQYNQAYLSDNKGKLSLLVGCAGVGAFSLYAHSLHGGEWGNWRKILSLAELKKLSSQECFENLDQSIKARYVSKVGLKVYAKFLFDTDREICLLKRYIRIGSRLCNVYVGVIFFITKSMIQEARTKIQKLKYMQLLVRNELKITKF